MKVSIIVPVYNVEKELEECLYSLLNQDFDSYEIICIDDCSTDGSYEIMRTIALQHSNICIIQNDENRGLSATRNRGLEIAGGEYIWFVDSDDVVENGAIKRLYDKAKRDNLDILYFNKDIFCDGNWGNRTVENVQSVNSFDCVYDGCSFFVQLEQVGYMSNAYTQFIRKGFITENKLFFHEGIVHEDILYFPKALMCAKRVTAVKDVFYHYRKREGSITSVYTAERKYSLYIVLIELLKIWKINHWDERTNGAFESYIKKVYGSYIRLSESLGLYDNDDSLNPADKMLMRMIDGGRRLVEEFFDFDDSEIYEMQNSGGIWIYGAGAYGKQLYRYCRYMDIDVKGFTVTSYDNEGEYRGKKIISIERLKGCNDLFVIAIALKQRAELEYTIKSMHCDNYIIARKKGEMSVVSEKAHEEPKRDDRLLIAFKQLGSMGDCIISLKLYQELVKLSPDSKFYILDANENYYRSVFFGQKNVEKLVTGFSGEKEYRSYDLVLEVRFVPVIRYIKHERVKELAPKLFEVAESIIRWQEIDGVKTPHYQFDNRILLDRAKINGWNRYSLLGNGIIDIHDQHVDFFINDDYKSCYDSLELKNPYITINCGAHIHSDKGVQQTKIWPKEYFEQLVKMIKEAYPELSIIQLGDGNALRIEGADKYIIDEDLETVKWILSKALVHIDSEGGLVHIASQLGTKCAVMFGPTPVWFFGYKDNINITSEVCGECKGLILDWYTRCMRYEFAECMYSIKPEHVMNRLTRELFYNKEFN